MNPPRTLGRRAALTLPLALGACSTVEGWFSTTKESLPGKREDVLPGLRGLEIAPGARPTVTLPPATPNAEWPQPGGRPSHVMGTLQTGARLTEAWRARIGAGGGYRAKITAQPVIAAGRVYAMDSNAVVVAFDVASGGRVWSFDTRAKGDRSSNVGGGLSLDAGTLYASTGRGDLLALGPGDGALRWRTRLGAPARSAPTVAEGRVYVVTIEQQLQARAVADGKLLWQHQATEATTTVLGDPAPAYADGLVVAGFGSGDLLTLRTDTGAVAWSDSITAAGGRNSLVDISAISGMPVIADGQVVAIGQGGLMVATDLHTGRRLWERDIAGSQTPYIAGNFAFVVTLEQRAAALDLRDGRPAWVTDLPRYRNPEKRKDQIEWYGPVLAGDRLVFAGTDKRALALSPYTGEILGEQRLPDSASVAPVVAAGTVFFVTADGSLLAYR